jgi:hypothetical protein
MMTGKKVLVVPLNWGLGHASRIIPIISALKDAGASVLIGGSPSHLSLLKEEFQNIDTLSIPYLRIRLSNRGNQILKIALQLPAFAFYIFREHRALKKIIAEKKIDLLISDNCYGLWNQKVYSIFITHQLHIKLPQKIKFLEKTINKINHWFIGNFDECWVPDIKENGGIAGELSHVRLESIHQKYLGIISRFQNDVTIPKVVRSLATKKILIIISGPENQRTIFENAIRKELMGLGNELSITVIRGLPGADPDFLPEGWYNHLPAHQLKDLIVGSDYIISRSGYSSIMDLLSLRRTALLIPTPGQTEQEYLAEYLSHKGLFLFQKQNEFNLIEGIRILSIEEETFETHIKALFNSQKFYITDFIRGITS